MHVFNRMMIMKLRTEIFIAPSDLRLSFSDKIFMSGSCFVENMSIKLQSAGLDVDVNPFGVVYNPVSIAHGIHGLLNGKNYTVSDLFENKKMFHSFSHHSRFSDVSEEACLKRINDRLAYSSDYLNQASVFVATFGTAYVYRLKDSGEVVSNCHKLPDKIFTRNRLTVAEIVQEWNELILPLRKQNPQLKFLFTVSPIRHWKDGAHDNQISKSTLLLAIEELIRQHDGCYYFPSYEIMMDDLRDYRFYADDMLHPSSVAAEYIWDKFSQAFFDKETLKLMQEWESIQQALNHRPFNPDSEEYEQFKAQTKQKLFELKKRLNRN